jgi:MoaA/NifB/PqqE/SkfB family radical SAM enzyme
MIGLGRAANLRPKLAGAQVRLGDLVGAAPQLARNIGGFVARGAAGGSAPAFVTWALTERCPMRCAHCDMGKARRELSRRQRLALAHQLAASQVWGVSLIGGEPTLLPNLADLASILVSAGKHVTLGSSGFGLERHLDALLRLPIANLTLSVDSHDAATHDGLRGRAGLFAAVEHAAAAVRAHRDAGGGPHPQVQIRATVHRVNFRALGELLDYWRPRADHVVLQVLQDNGIHHVREDVVRFRPEDRPALEAALAEAQAALPALRGAYLDNAARYVYEADALRRDLGFRCVLVPSASMTILPDGEAKLCYGRADSVVGDALAEGVEAIWQRAETARTARRMASKDYGCMCWEQACSGNLELLGAVELAERARGGRRGRQASRSSLPSL